MKDGVDFVCLFFYYFWSGQVKLCWHLGRLPGLRPPRGISNFIKNLIFEKKERVQCLKLTLWKSTKVFFHSNFLLNCSNVYIAVFDYYITLTINVKKRSYNKNLLIIIYRNVLQTAFSRVLKLKYNKIKTSFVRPEKPWLIFQFFYIRGKLSVIRCYT